MKRFITFIISIVLFSSDVYAQNLDAMLASLTDNKSKADTLYALSKKNSRLARLDSGMYYIKKGLPFAENTGNSEFIATHHT